MNTIEKIEQLKIALLKLTEFRQNLNSDNLHNFLLLKFEIVKLLDDNQRIRFNQIEFYTERPDNNGAIGDDLPF